jgi:hypothetical protein
MNRFNYTNLRNAAYLQMHDNVLTLAARHPVDSLGLRPFLDRYAPAVEAVKAALGVLTKSPLSPEAEAQERRRDTLFRGLVDTVKGLSNHFDPAKQQAAAQLSLVLKSYGNLAALPNDEETAAIADLHRELSAEPQLSRVALLGLGEWLQPLAEANHLYNELSLQRSSEVARRLSANMKAARTAVDKEFRLLLTHLEVQQHISPTPALTAFTEELNGITRHFETTLAQEKGIRNAADAQTN